ncbi:thioredoxin family protein [Pseudomonas marincola]|uniref:thioredoxin family protein n=1 Tax=Pseudomonas marincola TaxID=437900 RepID=UPI000B89BDFC|nr:thioredoxin family protein [Pseudomonas sp. MS19]
MREHSTCIDCKQIKGPILPELELTDFDADQQLLALPGISLVLFTSIGCASCRYARAHLPHMALPVDRLAWIDAADNAGLVQRYEVFHLPALFVVRDGDFYGAVQARLNLHELTNAVDGALSRPAEELP